MASIRIPGHTAIVHLLTTCFDCDRRLIFPNQEPAMQRYLGIPVLLT